MTVADVYINIPVKSIARAFTYIVPETLMQIGAGWRVLVPFGEVQVEGFVVETRPYDPVRDGGYHLRGIYGTVDAEAWFTPALFASTQELAEFYLCAPAEMMRLFMPGKSGVHIFPIYRAKADSKNHPLLSDMQVNAVYEVLLQGEGQRLSELRQKLPHVAVDIAIEKLLRYRLVHKEYLADGRDKARYEKYYRAATPITDEMCTALSRKRAQTYALTLFQTQAEWSKEALIEKGVSAHTIKNLLVAGYIVLHLHRKTRDSYDMQKQAEAMEEVPLTPDQAHAVALLHAGFAQGGYQGYLLFGVTGSGKTRVYIETARMVRASGRQVIVLVPEIALTGQLITAFQSVFAQDIVVMHSRLSFAERNDAIFRVRRQEAGIIIGARSALFMPAEDIGCIILDEEQDMSYKQDESPRYHARVVAEILARQHGALLLLGSATPALETYARACSGELILLSMPKRIGSQPMPHIQAVDMRAELSRGRRQVISLPLRELLKETLTRCEQAIIMLNRRGYSTFIMCRSCGAVITCNECGLPYVYHVNGVLLCHHCDTRIPVPKLCPKCGSHYIKYFGSGTEKLEEELHTLLPEAKVVRMDRDTTGRRFAHDEILAQFRRRDYDILLGTQMVAKGHDLPGVHTVGIISADASLNMPDFRAAERCFVLITQTAGRAGRHGARGEVIVQTYNPEHYAVVHAMGQDYQSFYEREIKLRRELFYPPFSRLVKILFHDKISARAWENAAALIASFQTKFKDVPGRVALGPSPALIARERGVYRFVVLIKTDVLQPVQAFLREQGFHLRNDAAIDIDPMTIF